MKNIRKKVFETNSSSMHSFTRSNGEDYVIDENEITNPYIITPIKEGVDFGSYEKTYSSLQDRINYCYTIFVYNNSFFKIKEKYFDKKYDTYFTPHRFVDFLAKEISPKFGEIDCMFPVLKHESHDDYCFDMIPAFNNFESFKKFILSDSSFSISYE